MKTVLIISCHAMTYGMLAIAIANIANTYIVYLRSDKFMSEGGANQVRGVLWGSPFHSYSLLSLSRESGYEIEHAVQRSASSGHRGVWLVRSRPLIGDWTAASNFDRLILAWTSI